jgi:hypothetical protein
LVIMADRHVVTDILCFGGVVGSRQIPR